jgi:hypothetical protein
MNSAKTSKGCRRVPIGIGGGRDRGVACPTHPARRCRGRACPTPGRRQQHGGSMTKRADRKRSPYEGWE